MYVHICMCVCQELHQFWAVRSRTANKPACQRTPASQPQAVSKPACQQEHPSRFHVATHFGHLHLCCFQRQLPPCCLEPHRLLLSLRWHRQPPPPCPAPIPCYHLHHCCYYVFCLESHCLLVSFGWDGQTTYPCPASIPLCHFHLCCCCRHFPTRCLEPHRLLVSS